MKISVAPHILTYRYVIIAKKILLFDTIASIMRSMLSSVPGTCSVDADDLSVYETAWTENNPDVQPGYELTPGEILHVGQCKEW